MRLKEITEMKTDDLISAITIQLDIDSYEPKEEDAKAKSDAS